MITGVWISQAIYAAAKFGIADHLKDSPETVEELAGATSTNPDALYRLLRALASVGILTEGEPRHFSLTPLAELLRSDVAGSKRALAIMSGDLVFRAWAEIEYSICTGKVAFEKVFGKPVFDYLGDHPDKARNFDAAMVGIHGRESNAILDAYELFHPIWHKSGLVSRCRRQAAGGPQRPFAPALSRHASMAWASIF
jgi:hypothetical protein